VIEILYLLFYLQYFLVPYSLSYTLKEGDYTMRSSNDEGRSPVPMDIGTHSVHPAMPAHDEQEGKAEKENSKRQKNNPLGNWNTVVTALPVVPLPQLNHTSTPSFTHKWYAGVSSRQDGTTLY
jgi:hypothetical protein